MAVAEEFAFEPTGSHRRRLLYALAALVLIGVGVASYMLVSAGSGSTPAAVTTTATVTTGNLVSSYTTTGTASATTSAQLSFSSTGAVKEVDVKPGDTVKSGQVLAKLDDTTIQRQIQTAQTNLQVAQLKLAQLMQPTADTVAAAQQSVTQANAALTTAQTNLQAAVNPSAADLAAAQQAVAQAQAGLATAQGNLTTAQAGPTASDLAAAQQAVDQAQVGLGNAQNGVGSAWTNLVAAQTNYCTNVSWFPVMPCQQADLPLTQASITGLNNELEFPIGTKADITTSNQAVSQFLSANTAYGSAQANVPPAQQALAVAQEKLKDLTAPPNATTLTQLQSAVTAAQQGLTSA
ncbi:MAG TPA: biotin/lipoyl-binding protein, partial [Tepidiformaceae bacterium]|nr:biotin/lipoyl-binding protein [Tepidiformaceae bacterium]